MLERSKYSWALKTAQSGRNGRLLGGSFERVISDPTWLASYWQADQVGGPMLDLHIHDAHFIRLLFGMPKAVASCGRLKNELVERWHSQFNYGPKGPAVQTTSGTITQQGRSFNHGFEIHLETATLMFEFAVIDGVGQYLCPLTILTRNSKVIRPKLPGGDPMDSFAMELKEVGRCVREGNSSEILNAKLAKEAIVLCHKQTESLRRRCSVRI